MSEEMYELPDGSGCFVASFPLPEDHWLYAEEPLEPPEKTMEDDKEVRANIREAVRWALRAATFNGRDMDFDPDAVVLNAVFALCGPSGLSLGRDEEETE